MPGCKANHAAIQEGFPQVGVIFFLLVRPEKNASETIEEADAQFF